MKINEIIEFLEHKYPLAQASNFDEGRIGLCLGSVDFELENILLTLDLNLEVIHEAINKNVNLIISHHPFIYQPINKILIDSYQGKIIELMIKNDISLYVMHTNLDVGVLGVNDTLAQLLGLSNIKGVSEKEQYIRYGQIEEPLYMLVNRVKKAFGLSGVRVAGEPNQIVRTVGIIGGSGSQQEEIDNAISLGCDCFISGEMKLHVAQYAVEHGLMLIEVNHGVEKLVFNNTKQIIENRLEAKKRVFISEINTDPLYYL